jgi:hypothetical protein
MERKKREENIKKSRNFLTYDEFLTLSINKFKTSIEKPEIDHLKRRNFIIKDKNSEISNSK